MEKPRIKAFLMLLCLLLPVLPAAAQTFTSDGIEYTVLDSSARTCELTNGKIASGTLVIPATVSYESRDYSVTSIGIESFLDCSGLISVEIPNSVSSIGNFAFSWCTGLTSVVIPNSVTSIGESAFEYCKGLTSVKIPNSVSSICNRTFSNCYSLTSVEIPASVTSIGGKAFLDCTGLTSVQIPNSVTSIGDYAFHDCSNLKEIVVDSDNPVYSSIDGVLFNRENTTLICCPGGFSGEYNIPSTVTSIGENAFSVCYRLTSVEIPNSVTSIGEYAFSGCGLTSVEIPNSVSSIDKGVFYGCTSLASVKIPNSVTSIGNNALYSCIGLTSVEIPNSVTSIGAYAFCDCENLTSIQIPNSVTTIGNSAFSNCTSLSSIVIPGSVTYIGNNAFYNCNNLRSVSYFAEDPGEGNSNIFADNVYQNATLYVSHEGYEKAKTIDPWKNFAKIETVSGYADFVYNIIDAENFLCEVGDGTKASGDVVIPSHVMIDSREYTVVSIGNNAFYLCQKLTSVEIPNSVTYIGQDAFYNCTSLNSIEIPNSVTTIGDYACYACSNLTSIEIPGSVTSIGEQVFRYCNNLGEIVVDSANSTYSSIDGVLLNREKSTIICCPGGFTGAFIIPNSVTSISEGAFLNCVALTSVEIPNSVTYIGQDAFSRCSGLTSIVIPNSVTFIGYRAFNFCSGLTSVVIPASVTEIDMWAFNNSDNIETVHYLAADPIESYSNIFTNYAYQNATLYVSSEGYEKARDIDPWKNFANIQIYAEKAMVFEYNGIIYEVLDAEAFTCQTKSGSAPAAVRNKLSKRRAASTGGNSVSGDIVIPSVAMNGETGFTVVGIGEYSFAGCDGLVSITLPETVVSIGANAFSGCTALEEVEIPESVTEIGEGAFDGCTSLTEVEIPATVTEIVDDAFFECTSLTSIEIPATVTRIGNYAFAGCTGLTTVHIPAAVANIGTAAFAGCTALTGITVDNANAAFASVDGVLFNREISTLICYPAGITGAYTIPESVAALSEYAFAECEGLTAVTILANVSNIGNNAFYGCTGLTEVDYDAFEPVEGDKNIFSDETYHSATLYVTEQAYAKARTIDPWRNFSNIEVRETEGITDAVADEAHTELYDLNGRRVDNPASGIYIRRRGTTTEKVIIR